MKKRKMKKAIMLITDKLLNTIVRIDNCFEEIKTLRENLFKLTNKFNLVIEDKKIDLGELLRKQEEMKRTPF